MTDLKKLLTVSGRATRNSASGKSGLFGVRRPVLSWAASAACCVKFSCGVLWSKAYLIYNVIRVSGNMGEVLDLSSADGVG